MTTLDAIMPPWSSQHIFNEVNLPVHRAPSIAVTHQSHARPPVCPWNPDFLNILEHPEKPEVILERINTIQPGSIAQSQQQESN